MENKSNTNSTVLSVYYTWLDSYEDKIGERTNSKNSTLITERLVNTIRRRYMILLERESD